MFGKGVAAFDPDGGPASGGDSNYMRRHATRFLSASLLLLCFSPALWSQSGAGEASRKIKVTVRPEYPALARQMNLKGTVRVEVVIAPDGKVKKAHVVGGHPLLALEAEKAALLTEFESGPRESTQILEFRFGD